MYSIKITAAEKIYIQATGQWQLAVDFDVLNQADEKSDAVVVAHYSHGFELDTEAKVIEGSIKDFLVQYEANLTRAEDNKEFDQANDKADSTIAAVVGLDITN